MRRKLGTVILAGLAIICSGLPSMAAGTIQIVPSTEGIESNFEARQQGDQLTSLHLAISAIAMTDTVMEGHRYQTIALPAAGYLSQAEMTEEGKPSVPILTTLVMLPDQGGVDLEISYSSFETFDNIDLAPVQPAALESDTSPPPFTIDEQAYATDAFYPGVLAESDSPQIMRDIRFAQISMYPVQYNPATRQLKVYHGLAVNVRTNNDNVNPKTIRRPFISDGFYPIYKAMFPNFDQVYASTEVRRGGYLIIAKDMFVDSLQDLAMWKHKKGYTVHICPATEIAANGQPSQTQIFTYIRNAYETWDVPPEYVMIVGDQDNISYSGINDYPYSSYPSDHKYACVDGSDYFPDIFVARLTIDNMNEFRKAKAKVMKYDSKPFMGDPNYYLRGLSVAAGGFDTARIMVLWVRQALLRNGFIQVDTAFSGGGEYYLPSYFNNGVNLISYRGYGSDYGWAGPYYDISDLNMLQCNQKLGVVASIVCGTADFGSECFGEMWIKMGISPDSLKGGPAYYGTSDHYTHTRWNNTHITGYYTGLLYEDIYHFAATAVRGKLNLYRTFPRELGTVWLYYNTYNMLGDPELEIRTAIPISLDVDYRHQVGFGENHLEISVTDTTGNPISGAFVTLVKGTLDDEEVFSVGKTNETGFTALSFNAETPGEMAITVSGRNLYPFQDSIEIASSDVTVGFDSLVIDDNDAGFSSGNGDGMANPNEILELSALMKNFGTTQAANDVTGRIEMIDPDMGTVLINQRGYGNIAPDETMANNGPYLVQVNSYAQDGELVRLKMTATDNDENTWYSAIEFPVSAAHLIVSEIVIDDDNNRLDPGDTATMVITLTNQGSAEASGVTARITSEDDFVSISNSEVDFGDIAAGESGSNSDQPLAITAKSGTFDGHIVRLVAEAATADGRLAKVPFTLTVGAIQTSDPVGPDVYGYYMYDDTDADYIPAPEFNWVEINPYYGGSGTRVTFPGGNYDDNAQIVNIPFGFVYYGEPYHHLDVSTNGFAAVDTAQYDRAGDHWANFFNWPIPDANCAKGQISPFWDDLNYSGSNYGVFTWYDNENHLFYVEWYHMTNRNTGSTETFQIIITDPAYYPTLTGDSEIYFQYFTVVNNDASECYSSVGFESWSETDGLQYTYDNSYTPGAATLANNRAIKITTNTGFGGVKGNVSCENADGLAGCLVSTSSGEHRAVSSDGDYWIKSIVPGNVSVTADAPGHFPQTQNNIDIAQDVTSRGIDFSLAACPVPVALQASRGMGDRIELSWGFDGHPDLSGYNVYRCRWQNGQYEKINGEPVTETNYSDMNVPDSSVYWYKVTAAFAGDGWTAESFASIADYGSIDDITDVEDTKAPVPAEFFISQNYPNPFNATTLLSYGLPEPAHVRIDIYNVIGQKVRTLVDEDQVAGYKSVIWDGKSGSGNVVASGVYFARVQAGSFSEAKKMMLLK